MDSITRFRVLQTALLVGVYVVMGVVFACVCLIMPHIVRGVSQQNAHAAAFAALTVPPLAGVVHGAIVWFRGTRPLREMKNRGESL